MISSPILLSARLRLALAAALLLFGAPAQGVAGTAEPAGDCAAPSLPCAASAASDPEPRLATPDGAAGGGAGVAGTAVGATALAPGDTAGGPPSIPATHDGSGAGGAATDRDEPAHPHSAPPDPEALARAYRRTGNAPTIERGHESLFPFGHGRPVLRCAPLRACAVELEPGELVLATSLGDSERWLLQAASSGPGARTPLLVVKPTACDLSTNLLVSTDRRSYELTLDSPPCNGADAGEATYNPALPYVGVVHFYYPDDLVRRWADREEAAREKAAREGQAQTPLAVGAQLARLNFSYSWDRTRKWPWVPSQIFDDGLHTYIVFSPSARLGATPLLFALDARGELAMVNYHIEGDTFVADRVLERAALLVGAAKKKDQQKLDITNRAFPAGSATATPAGAAAGAGGAAGGAGTAHAAAEPAGDASERQR